MYRSRSNSYSLTDQKAAVNLEIGYGLGFENKILFLNPMMNDAQGGLIPESKEEKERAAKADLITLPSEVKGKNCGNCCYIKVFRDYYSINTKMQTLCKNPHVSQPVNARMCCVHWDAYGVKINY